MMGEPTRQALYDAGHDAARAIRAAEDALALLRAPGELDTATAAAHAQDDLSQAITHLTDAARGLNGQHPDQGDDKECTMLVLAEEPAARAVSDALLDPTSEGDVADIMAALRACAHTTITSGHRRGHSVDLDALHARLDAATPGPLHAVENDLAGGWCVRTTPSPPSTMEGLTIADVPTREEAEWIAAARDDLPALADAVQRLARERDLASARAEAAVQALGAERDLRCAAENETERLRTRQGRCPVALTPLVPGATPERCALTSGHRGWHRADSGAEWTSRDIPTSDNRGNGQLLQIVAEWAAEYGQHGSEQAAELVWRLAEAGFPLPDDHGQGES